MNRAMLSLMKKDFKGITANRRLFSAIHPDRTRPAAFFFRKSIMGQLLKIRIDY